MIKGESQTVEVPNYETMLFFGKATPELTITGSLFYDELTAEQKITYDEVMPIVSGSYITTITNTEAELEINRLTSDVLSEEEAVIDFETLSEADKDKLRALLAILVSLAV